MTNWHSITKEEALRELDSALTGLTKKEAAKRQRKYGFNLLETKKKTPLFLRFISQFKDFMILTLIFAALVSFFVSFLHGELDFVEPAIIILIITLNAVLGVLQESKAEKSLEALQKMSAPAALVMREGVIENIDAKELVPGDIIYLETGHFVPADARLLTAVNLKIDEASLTGESHPIEKDSDTVLKENILPAERINMVAATGIVTYGRGTAMVTATGMHTEVGHIARLIMEDETPMTPLQKRLAATGKVLGIAALIICIIIFLIGILKNRPIFEMFMTAVSLAVAAIPEGLPAIVTIMLSLGVQRMAKKNAVIRKLPAVETLGSATVICSDKTGTLTQNKMTVTEICSSKGKEAPDGSTGKLLLTLASLCNDAILQTSGKRKHQTVSATGEPTENALIMAAYQVGLNKPQLDLLHPRIYEIPFDSARKQMTTIHRLPDGGYRQITKGAFDILLSECTNVYRGNRDTPITHTLREQLIRLNEGMTAKALRVIAVAYKDYSADSSFPARLKNNNGTQKDRTARLEQGLTLAGLIGMIDPPRPEVREAVLTCQMAGITPVMITGDHVSTACAIAKELGILTKESSMAELRAAEITSGHSTYNSSIPQAMTGAELSQITQEELVERIKNYRVFARVSPEHKVRIVKALQARGEVVAMTGDGVNDAPALKAADIGCAMGITGTDVAKNAADMILTDDNFATIVAAVKEGRGIYDNIKKAVHFLLSCNIGEILTIFVAIIFGLPSPLIAVQLLWVNLVTDSLPAISLGVDPPDKDIMKKKPNSPDKGMFSDGLTVKIITEGILIGSLALLAFIIGIRFFDSAALPGDLTRNSRTVELAALTTPYIGRTMAFAVLSLSQLFHSFNMRSEHSITKIGLFTNIKLVLSFIVCAFLQVIVISVKPLADIFKVVPLTPAQWSIVLVLSFLPIVVVELQKSKRNK
ncbi:cation-translocating P-type ATPase [Anaerocolumna xylanovorans]|uniref:Ca2+-transporting ATPase n=1 Tax=Anaerocolumna xylanovorans DSM 12503 TaxID=1121345 RepID=A0A1M7YF92_9FIRM|nr:cation-translocating P-type ATPase [Anaerocolumna xylanovorans]SHO51239.1 Ca2+-transporting ATPase [Anaerocolumna xylanovorans DSM 12503]